MIAGLETGELRVAEPDGKGGWRVNEWLKKAVLLYFRVNDMRRDGRRAPRRTGTRCRCASKASTRPRSAKLGARVVPGAVVRRGAHIGKDVVLMPSFVNIGAYVGEGTMVDTWATVGSCAQIGKHCHLSGGAGIGGVLEPLQASPTIIEDDCFIGARSEVVEGVVVEPPQRDRHGRVPGPEHAHLRPRHRRDHLRLRAAGSVVVSGSLPAEDGSHSLYCAVIVKQVDAKTRSKTSINELLRGLAE